MEPLGDEICLRGWADILWTLFGCQSINVENQKTDAEEEAMGVELI